MPRPPQDQRKIVGETLLSRPQRRILIPRGVQSQQVPGAECSEAFRVASFDQHLVAYCSIPRTARTISLQVKRQSDPQHARLPWIHIADAAAPEVREDETEFVVALITGIQQIGK